VGASGPLNSLLFGQVKSKLIIEQWDEMRRVASSIRHGTVSARLLMRKLAAYPRQNQVARALTEMGKLERTAYLLEYFRDEALRRRVLIGLNKGEALHALARQLFFGRLGELRDRANAGSDASGQLPSLDFWRPLLPGIRSTSPKRLRSSANEGKTSQRPP
jgi:TnpA family transposase